MSRRLNMRSRDRKPPPGVGHQPQQQHQQMNTQPRVIDMGGGSPFGGGVSQPQPQHHNPPMSMSLQPQHQNVRSNVIDMGMGAPQVPQSSGQRQQMQQMPQMNVQSPHIQKNQQQYQGGGGGGQGMMTQNYGQMHGSNIQGVQMQNPMSRSMPTQQRVAPVQTHTRPPNQGGGGGGRKISMDDTPGMMRGGGGQSQRRPPVGARKMAGFEPPMIRMKMPGMRKPQPQTQQQGQGRGQGQGQGQGGKRLSGMVQALPGMGGPPPGMVMGGPPPGTSLPPQQQQQQQGEGQEGVKKATFEDPRDEEEFQLMSPEEKAHILYLKSRLSKLEGEVAKAKKSLSGIHEGEGWLMKGVKKTGFWSWNWRYFRTNVEKRSLVYYTNPEDEKPIKTVVLPTMYKVEDMKDHGIKQENGFCIVTSKRTWNLVAGSALDKKRWMEYWKEGLFKGFAEGTREGWLFKEPGNKLKKKLGKWDLRYFRFDLNKKEMQYFQDDCSTDAPIKTIPLQGYQFDSMNNHLIAFQFNPTTAQVQGQDQRVWKFKATESKEKEDWDLFFEKYFK